MQKQSTGKKVGLRSVCRTEVSFLLLVACFLVAACAIASVLLDVGLVDLADSFTGSFFDWGFWVRFALVFLIWHFFRRCLHPWGSGPHCQGRGPVKRGWQKCRACIPEVVLLGIAVIASLLLRVDNETVGDVKWRYEVSGETARIGRGRSWSRFRAAISTGTAGDVEIPRTLGGYPVTDVGEFAFYKCKRITSVSFPNSVTNVGCEAFSGCRIEKVYVGKGDAARIKELLRGKGVDVDRVEFVEREETQAASYSGVVTCRP